MQAIPIEVEQSGVLRLPSTVTLPANARLAVLVFEPSESKPADLNGLLIFGLAQESGAFDFLKEEPDIYSDADILPGRENPRFQK